MSNPDWARRTCEDCYFQVRGKCRESPPMLLDKDGNPAYPRVFNLEWCKACSRHKPKKSPLRMD